MNALLNSTETVSSPVPIVFVHEQYSFYLEFSLRQAQLTNPESPLHLIGDARNNRFPFVQHRPISSLIEKDYRHFGEIYTHSSPNQIHYELFCFRRWFLLRELMHRHQYSLAFMADSDVMIYDQLARSAGRMIRQKCLAAYNSGADCDWVNSASGHSSFWTREGIDQFCQFLLRIYGHPDFRPLLDTIRSQKHLITSKVGISDMTALYLFMKQQSGKILNLSKLKRSQAFDHNVGTATNYNLHEYVLDQEIKRIVWLEQNTPVCLNKIRQQPVQMVTLHFQGPTKRFIHRHYTGDDLQFLRFYREARLQVSNVYHRILAWQRQLKHQLDELIILPDLRKSM